MDYTHFHARGSGRTTRMIEEALEIVLNQKKKVTILCAVNTSYYVKLAQLICFKLKMDYPVGMLEFKTVEQLEGYIDFKNKRLKNGSNNELLIDHHVWAEYFSFAIEGFHEYDSQMIINAKVIRNRLE